MYFLNAIMVAKLKIHKFLIDKSHANIMRILKWNIQKIKTSNLYQKKYLDCKKEKENTVH